MNRNGQTKTMDSPVVGVAGLGLIGGSLCRALTRTGVRVLGHDIAPGTVSAAISCGAVEDASTDFGLLAGADIIFVALFPKDIAPFVRRLSGLLRPGAIVVDCCGIKAAVCRELFPFAREKGFVFLGGHPMAGTEQSGFAASQASLFEGSSFLLVPGDAPADAVQSVSSLLLRCGFARVVPTTAERHDRLIAYTSQLPHALACAYVQSPSCPEHDGFAAGSYRDVSRVAHLDPEMWTELFLLNAQPLCAELDTLIGGLSAVRDAVASGNRELLHALLAHGRAIKDKVG